MIVLIHYSFLPYACTIVSPFGSIQTSPEIFAMVDDTVELMCTARGGPNNMFEWTHILNNQASTVTLSSTSNLTITGVTVYKGGIYRCTVSNAAGHDSGTTILNGKHM